MTLVEQISDYSDICRHFYSKVNNKFYEKVSSINLWIYRSRYSSEIEETIL